VHCQHSIARGQEYTHTSQEAAQVRCWVSQLVLFVVSVLQRDEDAEVVRASHHAHACSGKLGTELVVAPCADAFLRALNVESRDRRVVRGLLGQVRDGHRLPVSRDAVGAARGRRSRRLQGRMAVFDLPVTLQESVVRRGAEAEGVTYPEEFAQRRVVGLAWLALDVFLPQSQRRIPRQAVCSVPDPW
jgi:hypothetical protein